MGATAILTCPRGQILEIRPVDSEFWQHPGPIEFGQYSAEQDLFLRNLISSGGIVYHYTNLDSLCGIVRDGAIWASDVRLINDRAELSYALGHMRTLAASDKAGAVRDEILDAVFDPGRVWQFAACFSRCRDQLSQWRAYGAKIGVSIGFSRRHLARAIEAHLGTIVDCRYLNPAEFSVVEEGVQDIVAALSAPGALDPNGRLTNTGLQKSLAKRAVDIASSIKHKSFSEEQEVRLIIPIEKVSERVEFRSSTQSLIPFVKIDIDGRRVDVERRERFTNHLGMMEVLVWPNDADNQVLDAIDMLLSKAGGVLVRRSASPYRT